MIFQYPDTWTVYDDHLEFDDDTGTARRVQSEAREIEVPMSTIKQLFLLDLIVLAMIVAAVVGGIVALV